MNVIIILTEGYPKLFSANNTKGELIALGLKEAGCKVEIIDTPSGTTNENQISTGISLTDIKYTILPRKGKLQTIISNTITTYKILKKEKEKKDNFVIIGMTYYPIFISISLISKFLGYECTTLFQEWHISMKTSNRPMACEAWIKDKTFGYFMDGIFPISHFLLEKAKKFNKKQLIVPVLSSYYNKNQNPHNKKFFFTFCGHASYLLRNDLILNAFKIVCNNNLDIKLNLVLGGNKSHILEVKKLIQNKGITENVNIKNQIPQNELYNIYNNSIALLIPLDPNNVQDKARFSQKIAEYVASHRPIITNNVGEIPYYFTNNFNAMIVEYNADSYANAMLQLINNPTLADMLGKNGFDTGVKFFDYKTNGFKMKEFFKSL